MQKQYYSSREDSDYNYFKKQSKLRMKILFISAAVTVLVDVLMLIFCNSMISTIFSIGGERLVVDKLIFFIVALAALGVFTYLGYTKEEKRINYIVWNCFILIILLISLFRSL